MACKDQGEVNKSLINIFLQFEYPEVKPTESRFLNSGGWYKHYYCILI
jgi:hypothetical protein